MKKPYQAELQSRVPKGREQKKQLAIGSWQLAKKRAERSRETYAQLVS